MNETLQRWWDRELQEMPEVELQARRLLLDTLVCAAAGLGEQEPAAYAQRLAKSSPGPVRWPYCSESLSSIAAASLGAMSACWHEYCEGSAFAHGRPGLHAVPVAVALGLASGSSYREVLQAIVIGFEVGARAGHSMRIRPGLHVDGTWGVLGATATAARMLQLPLAVADRALAIAATQIPASSYRPVTVGATARNTYAAHACSQSILFAEAAAAGVTAPDDALQIAAQQLGSTPTTAPDWRWPAVDEPLILQGYLKPFAAVRHTHYGALAAQAWRDSHATAAEIDTGTIQSLRLYTYPEALIYCANRQPRTMIQAQFSLSYALSRVLCGYPLGPEVYAPQVLFDREASRLEALLAIEASDEFSGRGARLVIETTAGRFETTVESAAGDPDRPLSEDMLWRKAAAILTPKIGERAARDFFERLMFGALESSFADIVAGEGASHYSVAGAV